MGIIKLLKILGPDTSILQTGREEQQSALDLASIIEAESTAHETSCDYTIVNGYIYRVDGNDSLARKPFGKVLAVGNIAPEQLDEVDVGGQLWRELKRLSSQS